jgi:hypothetical protein
MKLHGLRHSCASALVGGGVTIVDAAARLGHGPRMLLGTYAHPSAAGDRAGADALAKAFQRDGLSGRPVVAVDPTRANAVLIAAAAETLEGTENA